MTEKIVHNIINNIIDNVIKNNNKNIDICLICHESLYDNEIIYNFCCNKRYHEECLVSYVALNQYPKCPICRKWVKKDIKHMCDIIYKEYELKNARKRLKLALDYTEDISHFSRTNNEEEEENHLLDDFFDNNLQNNNSQTDNNTFSIFEHLLDIPEDSPINTITPITNVSPLRNLMRHQRNQVSMMQRMFDESWNNFFRES